MYSKTALPDPDKKETKEPKKGSFKVRAIPCGLFIAYLLMIFILIWLLWHARTTNNTTFTSAENTVFLQEFNGVWSWSFFVQEFTLYADETISPHLCDIYVTPSKNVKKYPTQKHVTGDSVFQAAPSRYTGQILYLYQLQSLEYEVTAQSGNTTTTDGELLIFDNFFDYRVFVAHPFWPDFRTVFRKKFPIGAKNQPISTLIKFNTSNEHSFYFVTSVTPGNITFSYKATVNLTEYHYKDFGPKSCSFIAKENNTNYCTLSITPNTSQSVFAYVYSNANPDPKPVAGLTMAYHRELPPPSVLFLVCAMIFVGFSAVGYLSMRLLT